MDTDSAIQEMVSLIIVTPVWKAQPRVVPSAMTDFPYLISQSQDLIQLL